MNQIKICIAMVVVLLLLVGLLMVPLYMLRSSEEVLEPFYVGVTYCGSSVQEAKELVDKVADYTNLFVIAYQAFPDSRSVEEIGEYAIASNLKFAFSYSGTGSLSYGVLSYMKEKLGEQFIGIYYQDELGGKMLDAYVLLEDTVIHQEELASFNSNIIKAADGSIIINYYNEISESTVYQPNGEITVSNSSEIVTYCPNGTVTLFEKETNILYTLENGTERLSQIPAYERVLKQNPVQSWDDATNMFLNKNGALLDSINKTQLTQQDNLLIFTADYGLYWWDYKSGYDLVLAELGWNNSVAQEISLVRGAANVQGKSWGTIITWKYTQAPYLASGEAIFEQMKTSYDAGAEYVLIFNYSEDLLNPNILQEEHFQALERFWNDVVQNPKIKHGNIKTDAVIVLPKNYGWGMRHQDDTIWGIWQPDNTSQEIWTQLQSRIDQYGLKIDIIFEDSDYVLTEKYPHIYYL